MNMYRVSGWIGVTASKPVTTEKPEPKLPLPEIIDDIHASRSTRPKTKLRDNIANMIKTIPDVLSVSGFCTALCCSRTCGFRF